MGVSIAICEYIVAALQANYKHMYNQVATHCDV